MSTADELNDIMTRQEELDPELAAYYEEDGVLGFPSIRHPLAYSVPHLSNAMANHYLHQKQQALREALRKRDYEQAIWLHERPYRIDAFTQLCWHLGDSRYWKLLGHIYTDTENLWQNLDDWVRCLTAERRYRSHMMTGDERVALRQDNSPQFTVYRGFHDPGTVEGLSWTTNSIVGKFFARRLAQPGAKRYLAQGRVKRKDVLAYFDARSEYEMLILPGKVQDIEITEVKEEPQ